MDKQKLNQENPFITAFKEYQSTELSERLKNKFAHKPYFERFKALRLTALISSYMFNIFSGLTASTLVFFFAYSLSENWLVSVTVTLIFLILLEVSKRLTVSIIFKDILQSKVYNFPLILISVLLVGLSIGFSFFGSQKTVKQFTPFPILTNVDTIIKPLKFRIATLEKQKEEARKTKWQGTTTTSSQRTIETLSTQIALIEQELFQAKKDIKIENQQTVEKHINNTEINAHHFALVTLLLELLFILSTWYLEYYDFRSYVEMSQLQKITDSRHVKTLSINPKKPITTSNNAILTKDNGLKKAILKAKNNYNAFKSKFVNNKGARATNLKGMEKWEKEWNRLKALLKEKQSHNGTEV